MKKAAFDHPKVKRLAKSLGVPLYGSRGICEGLWHFAAKHAPQGDVGRWSDSEIAEAIDWDGEPKALVDGLVACRFL